MNEVFRNKTEKTVEVVVLQNLWGFSSETFPVLLHYWVTSTKSVKVEWEWN